MSFADACICYKSFGLIFQEEFRCYVEWLFVVCLIILNSIPLFLTLAKSLSIDVDV